MMSRVTNLVGRIFQPVSIVALLFSGCTCAGSPPAAPPTPSATVQAATPTVQVADTATIVPATATAVPIDTPTPYVESEAEKARRTLCEGYLVGLAGKQKLSARDVEARKLALRVPELVTCNAVANDSSKLCTDLLPSTAEDSPATAKVCLRMQSLFHELRAYPNSRAFMFDEQGYQGARQFLGPKIADALRGAMRSGDSKDCAAAGDLQSMCLAFLNLDKSLCVIQGKLAEADLKKAGEMVKKDDGAEGESMQQTIERSCRETIEERAFLAEGLEALADASMPELATGVEERVDAPDLNVAGLMKRSEFAKAALGRPQACAAFEKVALDLCISDAERGAPPPPTPAAAGPTPQ